MSVGCLRLLGVRELSSCVLVIPVLFRLEGVGAAWLPTCCGGVVGAGTGGTCVDAGTGAGAGAGVGAGTGAGVACREGIMNLSDGEGGCEGALGLFEGVGVGGVCRLGGCWFGADMVEVPVQSP